MEEIKEYIISSDNKGNPLSGERFYRVNLPPDIPVCDFWSVLVLDVLTGLMISTDQPWPSVHKQSKNLRVNPDGSIDIFFGPNIPAGRKTNWIQTIPEKDWYMVLHMYEPMEAWVNNNWKPGEIEKIK